MDTLQTFKRNSIIEINCDNNDSLSDSEITIDEPKKKSKINVIPYSFGDCKICNDKASGIHYGIATCEACKGFYKRSLEKHQSYSCLNNNDCKMNKISRNRCKSCRFKKCSKEGMSIDGIRMGRISKLDKLKALSVNDPYFLNLNEDEIASSVYLNREINSLLIFNKNSQLNDYNVEPMLFYPKEFKYWLNSQIDFIRNNDEAKKYNIIKVPIDSLEQSAKLSIKSPNQLFDFKEDDIFRTESEFVLITLLKDKVYQLYKRHIKHSFLINDSRERLKTKNYVDSNVENISFETISAGIYGTIFQYRNWLTIFAKEMPGFNKMLSLDLISMITNCSLLSIAIHINEFFVNNESFQITPNGYQLSRNRMNLGFGTFNTSLFVLINYKIKQLNLSEHETALFYPFSLCSGNDNLIKEKEKFHQLKSIYTKMLLYEFKLNGRDPAFLKDFKEMSELITISDIYKDTFGKGNKS